ncbi:excisionase family DNA-binding protein [Microbacterium sp. M1A1_1b]
MTTERRRIAVDQAVQSSAQEFVTASTSRHIASMHAVFDDDRTVQLPSALVDVVTQAIEALSTGAAVTAMALPRELSTTVAADLLGVSRPTLMKMIGRGEISAHKVGSHHRLVRDDVFALRRDRQIARAAATHELLVAGEAFD